MLLALMGVAAMCGFLIVMAFQLTLPTIKAKKAEALRRAVFEVIPDTQRVVTFRMDGKGNLTPLQEEDERAVKMYAGYRNGEELTGVAIEAQGQGFQDVIKVIYGFSPERERVVGMKVLESKETPGLGDKIGKDPAFLENFAALDVRLNDEGTALRNAITVVKKGKKTREWEIDSITGATISSKAIGKMLNESAQERIPQVHRNLPVLKEGG
jgi:electron transport complex protein RnfG